MAPRPKRKRPAKRKKSASVPSPPSSPPPVSTPLAAAVAASEPPSALREKLIKWKLSGATVAVTPIMTRVAPIMTRVVLNEGRFSPDEDALLWEAYNATNNGTTHGWTPTAANRVG